MLFARYFHDSSSIALPVPFLQRCLPQAISTIFPSSRFPYLFSTDAFRKLFHVFFFPYLFSNDAFRKLFPRFFLPTRFPPFRAPISLTQKRPLRYRGAPGSETKREPKHRRCFWEKVRYHQKSSTLAFTHTNARPSLHPLVPATTTCRHDVVPPCRFHTTTPIDALSAIPYTPSHVLATNSRKQIHDSMSPWVSCCWPGCGCSFSDSPCQEHSIHPENVQSAHSNSNTPTPGLGFIR